MYTNEAEHVAQVVKEAFELAHEIQETDRLMWTEQWSALDAHVHRLVSKYPAEAATFRLFFSRPCYTPSQYGELCKQFLRWVFVQKRLTEILQ